MRKFLLAFLVVFFAMVGMANATDPWFDGDFRSLKQSLGGWEVANKVVSSGGVYIVDVSKGPVHVLDTEGVTTGTSIVFTGGTSVFFSRGKLIFPGNGYPIMPKSGTGYAAIQYPGVTGTGGAVTAGTWPFATNVTSGTNRVYVIDFFAGVAANSGQAGNTVYFAESGVTIQ